MKMELADLPQLNTTTIKIDQELMMKLSSGDFLVVDIETNGLYHETTTIWVICVYDPATRSSYSYCDYTDGLSRRVGSIKDGLVALQNRLLIMHNGLKFDLPVLQKLAPAYNWNPRLLLDTLVLSRLGDPAKTGGHSIARWASRFGMAKVENEDWSAFDTIMEERCLIDVEITHKVFCTLWKMLEVYPLAVEIEHAVAWATALAEIRGFKLNVEKTIAMFTAMQQENTLALERLQAAWTMRIVPSAEKVMKRVDKRSRYFNMLDPGIPFCPVEYQIFEGSRQQAVQRLQKKYKWKPAKLSAAGNPELSDEALAELSYPECVDLRIFYDTQKKMAFIKSLENKKRKNGWLDLVQQNGRVYASINPLAAYTHRMAVSSPNLTQVPKTMREPWEATDGLVLVGADAAGLELRLLAHFVAAFDGGVWGKEVVSGDAHTINQKSLGLWMRSTAKRLIYAMPYGAGDAKLGGIWLYDDAKDWNEKNTDVPHIPNYEALDLYQGANKSEIGKAIKTHLLGGAIDRVKYGAVSAIKSRGYLKGLDGRKVRTDVAHCYSAIATLCQSAGAIVMKAALYLMPAVMSHYGLKFGRDYWYVMFIHDEIQFEARPECADSVGRAAVEAIKLTTELLGLRVPMDGEYKVGNNWSETH